MARWEQWVAAQGGTVGGDTAEDSEAAPLAAPASSTEGAETAGEAPTDSAGAAAEAAN